MNSAQEGEILHDEKTEKKLSFLNVIAVTDESLKLVNTLTQSEKNNVKIYLSIIFPWIGQSLIYQSNSLTAPK